MKASRKTKRGVAVLTAEPPAPVRSLSKPIELPAWLLYVLGFLAVYVCAFAVYWPALKGEFVFDDLHMPFVNPNANGWPLKLWLGIRPLLMMTYYANFHLGHGTGTLWYHVVNVFFHASATIVLFFALRRLLEWAKTPEPVLPAAFGACLFLLHPLQTEAVSYVSQRGEDLGALLYFTAFCIFLYRKPGPVTWLRALVISAIYGAAIITKEHTVTLPLLLLLTDYFFNPGFSFEGVKRNWRLYSLIASGVIFGGIVAFRLLKADTGSVGFNLPEFTAAQYLFTEFRVFLAYLGLFIYPLWQTIDYDFAISRTILDQGSALALGVIVAMTFAAIHYRRRFPLASYGFLVFGALLLPTSSLLPIRDPIVDRRLYLPMIGLILICIEFLRRWRAGRLVRIGVLLAICALLASLSYRRNEKWNNPVALWADAVEKNPNKYRVQFGLATAEFLAKQCHESIPHYQKAIALTEKPDYHLYMNLGLAQQCDNQPAEAEAAVRKSIELKATPEAWAALGIVLAEQGKMDESLVALNQAEKIQPNYVMTYIYRGSIYNAALRRKEAIEQFQKALVFEPDNVLAKNGLSQLQSQPQR